MLRGVDQGHDDAVGPGVERPPDEGGIIRRHPDQHGGERIAAQGEEVPEAAVVEVAMLRVEAQPVEAGVLEFCGGAGIAEGHPYA